ncbi:MAG: CBS domain-containing protein [Planctomycetes bacterium]|nr:CBS domain-containing protein [Planctomycetota bacterium]
MNLATLLTTAVLTCRTTDPLSTVAQSMWEGDLGCLPVLDAQGRVVGMLTDRDMLMATHLRGSPLWSLNAGDVMSLVVHALPSSATARDAAELMAREQLRRLPVLDADGRLLGILSLSTLARAVAARTCDLNATDIATALACICGPRFQATETKAASTNPAATVTLEPAPRQKTPTRAGTAKSASPGSISPGSISPGSISPGSISPGSISPGSISPGSISPGSISPGPVPSGPISPKATDAPKAATSGTPSRPSTKSNPRAGKK